MAGNEDLLKKLSSLEIENKTLKKDFNSFLTILGSLVEKIHYCLGSVKMRRSHHRLVKAFKNTFPFSDYFYTTYST